jgi:hypothetical protein
LSNGRTDADDNFEPDDYSVMDDESEGGFEEWEFDEQLKLGESRPRKVFLDLLDASLALAWYRQTGNPLFAWDVLATYLPRNELPPPDLRDYLQEVCRAVARASGSGTAKNKRRAVIAASVVPAAGNRGSAFEQYRMIRQAWAIEAAVDDLKMRYKYRVREQTMQDIYDAVAEKFHISADSVKKAYSKRNPKGAVFSIEPLPRTGQAAAAGGAGRRR